MPAFVLVHSPALGPGTWVPVARWLLLLGADAVVPDLRHIAAADPPYWPRIADTVADAMGQLDEPGLVTLVGHSNAGLLLPSIADRSPRPLAAAILVDAAIPDEQGSSPAAPPDFLDFLRGLPDRKGRLPRWSDWWPPTEIAALLPDLAVRREVIEDQPRLPLDYYEQSFPVPLSWSEVSHAYLRFSAAYEDDARRATARGWPVEHMPGGHLHQLVAAEDVARWLHGWPHDRDERSPQPHPVGSHSP